MADNLCFVQFPHPRGELGPDAEQGTLKRWGSERSDHGRKFMVAPGRWRDDHEAPITKGEIAFWAEWEAASTVTPVTDRVPGGPHWLHRPFFQGLKDAPAKAIPQNTDPFVFGDRFLYTYCRQRGNRKLRELADGSLILFGSQIDFRFVLDTVLVVAASVDHNRATYIETAASQTNPVFRLTTLDPMYRQGSKGCRLYFGATPEDQVNGMFSFAPCLPAKEQRTFSRPAIDLPEPFIMVGRTRAAGTTVVGDLDEIAGLWDQVVAQVVEQDCALGVQVELPTKRSPRGVLQAH